MGKENEVGKPNQAARPNKKATPSHLGPLEHLAPSNWPLSRQTTLLAPVLVIVGLLLASARSARAGDPPQYLDPPEGLSTQGPVVLENPVIHNIFMDGSWNDDNPASLSKENIDAVTQAIV